MMKPIAGLTLTLDDDAVLAAEAIECLRAHAGIEVGERKNRWLPLVIEAGGAREVRDLHRWIEELAGVAYVDVVYVGFDEEEGEEPMKAASLGAAEPSQASRLATRLEA